MSERGSSDWRQRRWAGPKVPPHSPEAIKRFEGALKQAESEAERATRAYVAGGRMGMPTDEDLVFKAMMKAQKSRDAARNDLARARAVAREAETIVSVPESESNFSGDAELKSGLDSDSPDGEATKERVR